MLNLRRLLLAAPLLALAAFAVYWLAWRDGTGDTPRASLIDTPPGAASSDVGVRKGQLARDFAVTSPSGETVRLSELRGAPVVVNFWATWCTSCLAEMPEFKRAQQELGPERLQVLAINAGEDSATAQGFIEQLDARDFRFGMDPSLVVADAYGVFGMPTSIFIDADGIVRAIYTGHLKDETLQTMFAAAAAGETAPEPDPELRLVTTIARDRLLEVREPARDRADLRSKSLRCDDSYCAEQAIDAIRRAAGVLGVDAYTGEDPPRIVITYEPQVTDADRLAEMLKSLLDSLGDPLYERDLEIARVDG